MSAQPKPNPISNSSRTRVDRLNDDDDTRTHEELSESSLSKSIDRDVLSMELVERWGIIDPELLLHEHGAELVQLLHFRFKALESRGALQNVKSMSGYFITAVRRQAAMPGPLPTLRELPERKDETERKDDYIANYLKAQRERGNR